MLTFDRTLAEWNELGEPPKRKVKIRIKIWNMGSGQRVKQRPEAESFIRDEPWASRRSDEKFSRTPEVNGANDRSQQPLQWRKNLTEAQRLYIKLRRAWSSSHLEYTPKAIYSTISRKDGDQHLSRLSPIHADLVLLGCQ